MRVLDTQSSICHSLKALPQRRYACAMWVLCGELESLYQGWLADTERSLMSKTLDLIRDVVVLGEANGNAKQAVVLEQEWKSLIVQRENEVVPPAGQQNVWTTFKALTAEIAGLVPFGYSADWVTNAAVAWWRHPFPRVPIVVDPEEVVDDSSPMAQTLAKFERVVTRVAEMPEGEWDPVTVRAKMFS